MFERNPEKVNQALQSLRDWNRKNPETPIRIIPAQIHQRVQKMAQTLEQRFIKSVPKELRADANK